MGICVNGTLHRTQMSVGGRELSHPEFDECEIPVRVRSSEFQLVGVDLCEHLRCEFSRSSELTLKGQAIRDGEHDAGASPRILDLGQNSEGVLNVR